MKGSTNLYSLRLCLLLLLLLSIEYEFSLVNLWDPQLGMCKYFPFSYSSSA